MCLLHCNATGDKGLKVIRQAGYKNIERHLADLAAADTVEQSNGLGSLFKSVDDWTKHPILSQVRKYRSSRHRFYFWGNHKDCNYHIRFVLPFKRDADDQPDQQWFKDKVIKAMSDEAVMRTLEATPPEYE